MKLNKTRQQLIDMYIHALEEDILPWRKGWDSKNQNFNPISNTKYKGVNNLLLSYISSIKGYTDPRWVTFNQASKNGWQIKQGAKGVPIEYWSIYDTLNKKTVTFDEYRNSINEDPEKANNFRIVDKIYHVFNAKNVQGIPEYIQENKVEINTTPFIENLIKNMDVHYEEKGDSAFYSPLEDTVVLPHKEQFHEQYEYDSTKLHELCHATGHPSRLNRSLINVFGSEDYAREELRAEIASSFLSQELQINTSDSNLENHKAYIQSWILTLKKEPTELFKAIKEAEKISEYVLETGEIEKYKISEEETIEESLAKAQGNTDLESTHSSRIDLAKRGINWRTAQPFPTDLSKPRLFVDMDGVEAKFNNTIESLEVLHEKGYYSSLLPQQKVVDAINNFNDKYPGQVYILSAALDSPFAVQEKIDWLKEFNPGIEDDHILLCPYGMEKSDFVPGGIKNTDYLLDDFTKNIQSWNDKGGKGIKLLNNINNLHQLWNGMAIHFDDEPSELSNKLENIVIHNKEKEYILHKKEKPLLQINVHYRNNDIYSIREETTKLNKIFEDVLTKEEAEAPEIRVNLNIDGTKLLKNENIQYHDLKQHQLSIQNNTSSSLVELLKDKAKDNILHHRGTEEELNAYSRLNHLFEEINKTLIIEEEISIGPAL